MNCEHVWPQSMYEVITTNIMKSDMHHLRPCKENANSYRSNKPFGESIDNQTNNWLWQSYNLTSIPSSNINEYSENGSDIFEPREAVKGDIARAMFYFYAMYSDVANDEFWELQKETLMDWNYYDEADEIETERTWKIAEYQDELPNPFVLDSTLARRIWYPQSNLTVEYSEGWNMVGLPLSVNDNSYLVQFPNAVGGTLYGYNGVYSEETNLENGKGYWLRISINDFNTFTGESISQLNIYISEGWNMISGLSTPVQLENIIDDNDIIIEGTMFGFDGIYQESESLLPGKGYWLKASSSGIVSVFSN